MENNCIPPKKAEEMY